jgi:hypothetical protein
MWDKAKREPKPEVVRPEWMGRRQAAAHAGRSVRTFEDMARNGTGPPYYRPAGTNRVLYRRDELDVWIASGRRTSTADATVSTDAQS